MFVLVDRVMSETALQDHLPVDVKRVCDLYDVKVEGYYDSSFDREFEERLKDVPLLKEVADFLEKAPVHQ